MTAHVEEDTDPEDTGQQPLQTSPPPPPHMLSSTQISQISFEVHF